MFQLATWPTSGQKRAVTRTSTTSPGSTIPLALPPASLSEIAYCMVACGYVCARAKALARRTAARPIADLIAAPSF